MIDALGFCEGWKKRVMPSKKFKILYPLPMIIFALIIIFAVSAVADEAVLDFENDLDTRQIAIEALVVEINEDYTRDLGITYTFVRDDDKSPGNNLRALDFRFPFRPDLSGVSTFNSSGNDYSIGRSYQLPGIGVKLSGMDIGPGKLSGNMRALLKDGKADIRAHAIAVALHNTHVTIETVDEVPFQDVRYDTDRKENKLDVTYEKVGVKLKARPVIKDINKGRINLLINEVNLSNVSGFVTLQQVNRPIIAKSSANTSVDITSGETFVLGGFKIRRNVTTESGIPLLRSIPYLGYLFKNNRKIEENKDILFFLTPYLLNPSASPILPYDFRHGKFLEVKESPVKY